jgi:hypothetical protein
VGGSDRRSRRAMGWGRALKKKKRKGGLEACDQHLELENLQNLEMGGKGVQRVRGCIP